MDKVFSARVDEAVLGRIGLLSRQLRTSKKAVIERAVLSFAAQVEREQGADVLQETSGAWCRRETVAQTVAASRRAFRSAMAKRRR
jgi:hypothetical protein